MPVSHCRHARSFILQRGKLCSRASLREQELFDISPHFDKTPRFRNVAKGRACCAIRNIIRCLGHSEGENLLNVMCSRESCWSGSAHYTEDCNIRSSGMKSNGFSSFLSVCCKRNGH